MSICMWTMSNLWLISKKDFFKLRHSRSHSVAFSFGIRKLISFHWVKIWQLNTYHVPLFPWQPELGTIRTLIWLHLFVQGKESIGPRGHATGSLSSLPPQSRYEAPGIPCMNGSKSISGVAWAPSMTFSSCKLGLELPVLRRGPT